MILLPCWALLNQTLHAKSLSPTTEATGVCVPGYVCLSAWLNVCVSVRVFESISGVEECAVCVCAFL